MKTKKWFTNRIREKVYRKYKNIDHKIHDVSCCPSCEASIVDGIIIVDESHADYLWQIEADSSFHFTYSDKQV